MSKIFVWGTGKIASVLLKNLDAERIEGFIETRKTKEIYYEKRVYSPEEIPSDFDAIIVATIHTEAIYECASRQGLDISKIIFLRRCHGEKATENLDWKKDILGENVYEMYLGEYGLYEQSFFERDRKKYTELNQRPGFVIKDENIWPIIRDKFMEAGSVHNYFLQDLWAARLVYQNLPQEHYDIGSRLDGFIAHVLSFGVPVKMIDIRPFPEEIDGLETMVGNATDLKEFEDESMESLSALCSLEHFGLGRYGDPVDPEACFKCFENIQRKLKKGGNFYLALPVGRERVEFNAHRIFYASTIIECFHNLQLMEFSCAADKKIERDVEIHKYDQDTHDREYRYGLFHFRKM